MSSEERERRYLKAILQASSLYGEYDVEDQVDRVMAVADAEQAELRAAVERLRMVDDGRLAADLAWMDRAEGAESRVARVEALLEVWEADGPQPASLPVENVRAALDGE